jgi:hypothetical protein
MARLNIRFTAWLAAAIGFGSFGLSPAEAMAAWMTGTALQRRLAEPVDISWPANPLRESLQRLSQAQQVAVLLDRRVDPGRKVQLKVSRAPLRDVFAELASRQQMGFCLFGPVAYFGPPSAAARIRTLSAQRTQESRRLPPAAGRTLLQPKALAWADLATPRDILAHLAQQNGLTLDGLNRVPHDLWAAADLPPLTLVDRLTLVAAQFDLTFSLSADGRTVTLLPIPEDLAAEDDADGESPTVKPRRPVAPPERPGTGGEKRVHTLRIEKKPVGPVLQELAKRLGFDLRLDQEAIAAAGISLDQLISLQVQKATDDELLRAVTRPAGLEFRRQGNVVEVGPAK